MIQTIKIKKITQKILTMGRIPLFTLFYLICFRIILFFRIQYYHSGEEGFFFTNHPIIGLIYFFSFGTFEFLSYLIMPFTCIILVSYGFWKKLINQHLVIFKISAYVTIFLILFSFIPQYAGMIYWKTVEYSWLSEANKIIFKLELFNQKNNHYPLKLTELENLNNKNTIRSIDEYTYHRQDEEYLLFFDSPRTRYRYTPSQGWIRQTIEWKN